MKNLHIYDVQSNIDCKVASSEFCDCGRLLDRIRLPTYELKLCWCREELRMKSISLFLSIKLLERLDSSKFKFKLIETPTRIHQEFKLFTVLVFVLALISVSQAASLLAVEAGPTTEIVDIGKLRNKTSKTVKLCPQKYQYAFSINCRGNDIDPHGGVKFYVNEV